QHQLRALRVPRGRRVGLVPYAIESRPTFERSDCATFNLHQVERELCRIVTGTASSVPMGGQTIYHRRRRIAARKRFIVCADEKLTAFLELQRAIHQFAVSLVT